MFSWKSKWKVSTVSLLLKSGNLGCLHDTLQILSEFASASYLLSVRHMHCAWNRSMQSLLNWISVVPSSTSFPHMAHRYRTVFVVLKAIKRVCSTRARMYKEFDSLFCSLPALLAQEVMSYTPYIFELHLPRICRICFIAVFERRPSTSFTFAQKWMNHYSGNSDSAASSAANRGCFLQLLPINGKLWHRLLIASFERLTVHSSVRTCVSSVNSLSPVLY